MSDFGNLGDILKHPDLREKLERLMQAGVPVDDVEPTSTCERCHDSGWLRRERPLGEPSEVVECPCGLVARRRRDRIWARSQVPTKMQGYTLESYAELTGNHELVANLRAWMDSDCWALFTGDVGLGKTGLAVSLLLALMRAGKQGLYVVTPSFLSRIRATYGRAGEDVDEMEVLGSVIDAEVLVLDDLGKVQLSEWGQEKLFTVINERYLADRRTIVTSNLDVEDGSLETHLWPATWDRIRGASDTFKLTDESLRGVRA